jgi:3-hydroxy-9,10-secoandrosta-1,3,5(10)-triene-9,17-dione monooxygenase
MSTAMQITHEDVAARVGAVVPTLRANAQRAEADGRVPDENMEALRESGFLRLMAPKRYGGLEASWASNIESIAEVGRGCASTSWIAATGAAGQWIMGTLPDDGQDEIFGDAPDVQSTCVLQFWSAQARPDGDDWILDGKWPFSTGCLNHRWIGGGAIVGESENGAPRVGYFVFPASQARIERNWDVTGMSGTGSNTVVAENVRIPSSRMIRLEDLITNNYRSEQNAGNLLWNTPASGVIFAGSLGTPIGIARNAIEAFVDRLPGRAITYSQYTDQSAAPITHIELARASTLHHAAEALAAAVAATVDRKNHDGSEWSMPERAQMRGDGAMVVSLARDAVQAVFDNSGATGIKSDVVVQRCLRDINALSVHALLHKNNNFELYGRVMLGGDPMTPLL